MNGSPVPPRISRDAFRRLAPDTVAALTGLGESLDACGLDPALLELVRLRASQLNGCAYSIQHHLNAARTLRISRDKLDLLIAWREVSLFSERERAALAWTEALTEVALGVDDDDFDDVRDVFSEQEVAHLSAAVALVNAWNRVAVAFRFKPEPLGPRAVET